MTTDISVVRGGWDPTLQQEIVDEYEYDGGNSSSRLFERSRIKALAGMIWNFFYCCNVLQIDVLHMFYICNRFFLIAIVIFFFFFLRIKEKAWSLINSMINAVQIL